MKLSDLPDRYQAQAATQITADDTRVAQARSRRVAKSGVLMQCAKCDFPATSNLAALERHCDAEKHHRYVCLVNDA